jgi:hypothetical protein
MKQTKKELVRKAMYLLAGTVGNLDWFRLWEVVTEIKALGEAYGIDVYDKVEDVDGEQTIVGIQIEDEWFLFKGFDITNEIDYRFIRV